MIAKSVLVVASVGALACSAAMGANVLQNPGFEEGLSWWSGGGVIRGGDPTPHGGLAYLFGGAVSSYYTHQMLTPATMGVTEAGEAARKVGYKTTAKTFRTMVNQALIKHKDKFKKLERGQYTAA